MNKDKKVINEFDRVSKSDIKKDFKDKYNMDITKYFNDEYFKLGDDFRYHGKHKGKYEMFTYYDNSNNRIMGRCPVFGINVSDADIGGKKDVDLLVDELKDVIDWFISGVKEGSNVYFSPFLKKRIKI